MRLSLNGERHRAAAQGGKERAHQILVPDPLPQRQMTGRQHGPADLVSASRVEEPRLAAM
jgi:hypothetical protein